MKTPYKNIHNLLSLNRHIVWSLVIGTTATCIIALFSVLKMHREILHNAFVVNNNGSVIPLKWVAQKENLTVEALSHLELFHTYFYNIDASNYKNNLGKALWLGDSSVDGLYRQKNADGVYNRLLQYSLVQKVIQIDSRLELSSKPYTFTTTTIFEINRGTVTDTYELVSTGQLIHVDRNFPKNTHGLLITNYFEKTLKKLHHEN
ncbi:conjugal transfer protein TraK [Arenibacter aquaticus]|uniref:Conjugal transfer protein TraK n=1 Tax=Arenibacter aquaticus TaxID=2489054 RepID=A0A3S0INN2_9FLAO|nr:conjugal transfer protein TraK [Arenibacter aquaticus]RTE54120.1 conjugal transfer protein TraK [Arenibacter aquaticus]